jgi:hypothetical protein
MGSGAFVDRDPNNDDDDIFDESPDESFAA